MDFECVLLKKPSRPQHSQQLPSPTKSPPFQLSIPPRNTGQVCPKESIKEFHGGESSLVSNPRKRRRLQPRYGGRGKITDPALEGIVIFIDPWPSSLFQNQPPSYLKSFSSCTAYSRWNIFVEGSEGFHLREQDSWMPHCVQGSKVGVGAKAPLMHCERPSFSPAFQACESKHISHLRQSFQWEEWKQRGGGLHS